MDLEEKLETKGKCMWEIKLCGWYLMSKVLDTDHLLSMLIDVFTIISHARPIYLYRIEIQQVIIEFDLKLSLDSFHRKIFESVLNNFGNVTLTQSQMQRSQTTARSRHPSLSCSPRPLLSCSRRPTLSDDLTLWSSLTLMFSSSFALMLLSNSLRWPHALVIPHSNALGRSHTLVISSSRLSFSWDFWLSSLQLSIMTTNAIYAAVTAATLVASTAQSSVFHHDQDPRLEGLCAVRADISASSKQWKAGSDEAMKILN